MFEKIGTVAAEQNHQLRMTNAEHHRIVEEKEILLNQIIFDRDLLRTEIEVGIQRLTFFIDLEICFTLAIQRSL